MFRIGIIGTENSHAMAFAKAINLPDADGNLRHPDARVVGVYGPDVKTAQAIIDEANADFIAAAPDDFHGKVDAMFITNRKGSLHARYALPFIEKGLPVFIDKPFTSDVAEAEALISAAKKHGAKLCGGSTFKLAPDVLALQGDVRKAAAAGDMVSASLSYAADISSEYDGFWFYSPHLVETAITVFGPELKSVAAFDKNNSRIALWRYADFDVTLHFTKDAPHASAAVYTKKGSLLRNIVLDHTQLYEQEVALFLHMLRTGEMPQPYEDLLLPVKLIAAIQQAAQTGREVFL